MTRQDGYPVVERFAQFADSLGVFRNLFLAPSVGHRAQQGDQGRGRCQNHLLFHADFDQFRILLKRSAEEGFAGKKENHELRSGTELVPV